MGNKDNIFDSQYEGQDSSTQGIVNPSEIKQLLKEPIDKADIKRYGESKPKREQIRARILHGKGKNK